MGILKDCINNKKTSSVPVWFMRQAGRYLPEFRDIRFKNTNFINLCLNSKLAKEITNVIKIPTIGIGSSHHCDGQILVVDDLLGISGFYPIFVKKYLNLEKTIDGAIKKFKKDVLDKKFPNSTNTY